MRAALRVLCFATSVVIAAGCASTKVTVTPSPQAPVCDARAAALVLWAPEWRADQKDVPEREAAAASGLDEFFRRSGCFARSELRRVPDVAPATKLLGACPNCGGELVRRPRRPAAMLVKDPASTKRVHKPQGCGDAGVA